MSDFISLCRNSDFQRLYHRGKSAVRPTMVMYVGKGRRDMVRLGITAGKKVGGAVCRNRAKRRIREPFRLYAAQINPRTDVCIVARGRILNASADKIKKDFLSAASELGLIEVCADNTRNT